MNRVENKPNRRAADRFLIEREVIYKVLSNRKKIGFRVFSDKSADQSGTGKTVNMSSSGISFTTEQLLRPGTTVELSIDWPALLDNKTRLKMVARGGLIRSENGHVAMEIEQSEFRTSGSQGHVQSRVENSLARLFTEIAHARRT